MARPVYRKASLLELQAWAEATDIRTLWRLHYKLPPNDPRVLEMTEDAILHDLFVIRYHQHHQRMATDAHYAAEQASMDPAVNRQLDQLREALERDDTLGEMARAHHQAVTHGRSERTTDLRDPSDQKGAYQSITLGLGSRG